MLSWRVLVLPNCANNKVTHVNRRGRSNGAAYCLIALMSSLLWVPSLAAQANEPAPPPPAQPSQATPASPNPAAPAHPAHPPRRRPTLDDRVKTLATALELSEPQQVAVKKILEQRQLETLRLRQDPYISGSERIDRFRALQDQTVERIRSVLNDEQKKKYNPLAVREIKPAPDQKSVEDWLKETTPKSPPSKP
ncbi:MAG TPA: hypothetical protein VMS18_24830 [Candidatus Binatia bacterium]|nr:hypothetical protein [Candidatus Binatia bacterium]